MFLPVILPHQDISNADSDLMLDKKVMSPVEYPRKYLWHTALLNN
jgi:hypothetical protein